jgi:uncharacterized protein (DUF2267 family)
MSATGLDVFDKTLQTTNVWLDEIMSALSQDRKTAWKVLSVVLHKLRDRLPIGLAAHLGAQLPMLVRGAYYDQFEPAKMPNDCDCEGFILEVGEWLADTRLLESKEAIQTVFRVLSRHLERGQVANVQNSLPRELRELWLNAEHDISGDRPAS